MKRLWKRKIGRTMAAALSLTVLLGLTACGSGAEKSVGGGGDGAGAVSAVEEQTEAAAEAGEGEEAAEAAADAGKDVSEIVFGNSAKNLIRDSYSPCFGDGRVYYINQEDMLCSFALDGSDPQTHTGSLMEEARYDHERPAYLNYYQGKVYYIATIEGKAGKELDRHAEIFCVDPASGAVESVASFEDEGGNLWAKGMLIMDDELFYSVNAVQESSFVGVINLATGETNEFFKMSAKEGDPINTFDTDGTYLYMFSSTSRSNIRRVLLADVYEAEPPCDTLVEYHDTLIPADGGFYTLHEDVNTHDSMFLFYSYAGASDSWQGEERFPAENGELTDDVEKLPGILPHHADMYAVGDGMASLVRGLRQLYYAPTDDYRESVLAAELTYTVSATVPYYHVLHAGVYGDTLYLVTENENGAEFHALMADGTFQ